VRQARGRTDWQRLFYGMILVLDARLQGRKTIKPIHRDLRDATSSRLLARSDPRTPPGTLWRHLCSLWNTIADRSCPLSSATFLRHLRSALATPPLRCSIDPWQTPETLFRWLGESDSPYRYSHSKNLIWNHIFRGIRGSVTSKVGCG